MFRDAVHDLSKSNDLLVYTQTSKREGGALICRTTVMQSSMKHRSKSRVLSAKYTRDAEAPACSVDRLSAL